MATTEQTMTSERLDAFMDAWNAHDVEESSASSPTTASSTPPSAPS